MMLPLMDARNAVPAQLRRHGSTYLSASCGAWNDRSAPQAAVRPARVAQGFSRRRWLSLHVG